MHNVEMNTDTKILGVEGSPRKNGNSHHLLRAILEGVTMEDNTSTHCVHLRDYRYEPCIGCEKCRKDKICTRFHDGMTLLYPELLNSRGLVLISPVHNYNITAWMKAFIDRLYCFYEFKDTRPRQWSSNLAEQGRKAVIVAIAEQENKKDMGFALDAMHMPLEALGYEIITEIPVLKIFDRGGIQSHPDILEKAKQSGAQLAHTLRHRS
ncbi:flavodoxin family protein [Desulfovibrio inopinatus]|uniref:flavodoxin family protein n=1 Tax=Desulfovibrio inopinatus TaxID=102109 RepID=UPI00041E4852|nr:flavodoxin family protein [Desulfovibrio inopinatus]